MTRKSKPVRAAAIQVEARVADIPWNIEHASRLVEEAVGQGAEIVGVAIRDRPEDIARFLAQHGNPYSRIGRDDLSEVQLAIGSSGVPETFVIDGEGVIRYQHIGDVRASDVPVLLEQLEQAR